MYSAQGVFKILVNGDTSYSDIGSDSSDTETTEQNSKDQNISTGNESESERQAERQNEKQK